MPKIYQAYYRDAGSTRRHHGASRTKVETEARTVAKDTGKEVSVDALEMEKPSLKYLVELLNGEKPTERERLCTFVPYGPPVLVTSDGGATKYWRVKKKQGE